MQLPIIEAAKKLGMVTAVMDKNRRAPGMKIADIPLFFSISNKKQAVNAAVEMTKKYGKIDGVVTVGTDFSTTVCAIARRLKLPATEESIAKKCTDKSLMRQTLSKAGLIQPIFKKIEKQEKFSSLQKWKDSTIAQWKNDCKKKQSAPYPAVVKPVDSMGARGVIKVNDDAQLKKALAYSLNFSPTKRLLIEKYLSGKGLWSGELSIDALIFKGKISITGIADRMITHPPYFVEDGHIIPSVRPKKIIDASVKTFKKAIRALKIQHGAAKGDIILTEEGPVIGEIAARLSGGFMSGYTYPLSSGVDLMEKMLLVACGINPYPIREKKGIVVVEHALYSKPGKIKEIQNLEKVRSMKGVEHLFIHVQKGSEVKNPENNLMKCGNVIVSSSTVGKAMDIVDKVRKTIFFQT